MGIPPTRGFAAAGWALRDSAAEFQEDGAGLGAFHGGSPALSAPPSLSSPRRISPLPAGVWDEPGTEAPHPFLHSNLMQQEREKKREGDAAKRFPVKLWNGFQPNLPKHKQRRAAPTALLPKTPLIFGTKQTQLNKPLRSEILGSKKIYFHDRRRGEFYKLNSSNHPKKQ